ncbi:MAG: ribose ABC transporter permease [Acidobacteriota bacterium]|nr:ribose ABC transporter permease [Acidobacteriota bacterium]
MKTTELLLRYGRQFGTLAGLIALSIVLWIMTPHFLTISNLLNIAQQTTIVAIIAVGMTFVIITAGIDLSVGSVLAFAGVVMASLLQKGVPLVIALLAGLGTGLFCGLLNGLLITFGKLPPFIATLGMMSIARGAALVYTGGRPISGFSDGFRRLAVGEVFHISVPIIIMIAVYLIAHFVLTKTKLGRYTYAIGGNEEAAILSGVNVRFYKTLVYGLCGMLSGLAAIILTARLNSAQPIAGIMYELDAIAATVIGGTSLAGGEGKIFGTLIGALIIGVLRNGLNLLDISSFVQQVVIGAVIIVAVLFDMALKANRK